MTSDLPPLKKLSRSGRFGKVDKIALGGDRSLAHVAVPMLGCGLGLMQPMLNLFLKLRKNIKIIQDNF